MRLLIVDDEALIRTGLRRDLAGLPQVEIVGECGTVAETIEAIRRDQIDLILLDVQIAVLKCTRSQ